MASYAFAVDDVVQDTCLVLEMVTRSKLHWYMLVLNANEKGVSNTFSFIIRTQLGIVIDLNFSK